MTVDYTNDSATHVHAEKRSIERTVHAFAVSIILDWLAICVVLTVFVPSLEVVEQGAFGTLVRCSTKGMPIV
ncbi:hypothetical protein DIJ64_01370 [Mycobacterium leprae]|uniref:Uncharacterized protein n=1 Tax=Mycobacterium leprae TaxID=1769 RepID=A0AAD0KPW4_MYCLR|nr:hypothetical protein [Mycobacterium leprae]AWV47224.1 hypothetical protein DIJ64_01370 [Mycobacterium leprae]OAR21387.1 hypothetical protein A8144_06185 [Mycobacterium leprae 3125609]OAX71585.1 hypothetical protein A3216_04630 [Mycobacterium leprae 7935681]